MPAWRLGTALHAFTVELRQALPQEVYNVRFTPFCNSNLATVIHKATNNGEGTTFTRNR
jgi:hypothetical protein